MKIMMTLFVLMTSFSTISANAQTYVLQIECRSGEAIPIIEISGELFLKKEAHSSNYFVIDSSLHFMKSSKGFIDVNVTEGSVQESKNLIFANFKLSNQYNISAKVPTSNLVNSPPGDLQNPDLTSSPITCSPREIDKRSFFPKRLREQPIFGD